MDVAVRAVQVRREPPREDRHAVVVTRGLCRRAGLARLHAHAAPAYAQRGFERIDDPGAIHAAKAKPVLHHFELRGTPRMDPAVALLLQQAEHLGIGEILRYLDRERHHEARIAKHVGSFLQRREYRFGCIATHGLTATPAVQVRRAREQQLQMVVQLGHRPDGGA